MTKPLFFLGLISIAAPALARDPVLSPPINCTLGDTCYIQSYVDTDPGPGAADFTCGTLSYDGHKGTDFALPAVIDLWNGVDVLASAPGTVIGTRDGMEDFPQGREGAPDITGKECGNGVVVDHGDGWVTQYCHMMKDSIAVQEGDRVSSATVLGQVGLSGLTQFPHVHLSVRHNDKTIDPFNPAGTVACGPDAILSGTLWDRDMVYQAGGLLDVGIDTTVPEYEAVKAGTAGAAAFTTQSPALVVYGFAYGSRAGDVLRLSIFGPEGEVISQDAELDRSQAQLFRAIGKRNPGTWPTGGYSATVQMLRDGTVIDQRETRFQIAP
ncbi:M23 family metallopeptidase [Celeribacter sp. PS-C1]|uniref:M23 family metallopeptidase n=1 Tax=Celeribacter sp. PS-C1 TaxID=2820813 RepID=UPI001C664C3E|nr:M23 family metallopeptidase [Celeribacter sp. PS-C1]MBW6419073.1 M23 family metallopeptidase [Celeribacter sp. PS-C1]